MLSDDSRLLLYHNYARQRVYRRPGEPYHYPGGQQNDGSFTSVSDQLTDYVDANMYMLKDQGIGYAYTLQAIIGKCWSVWYDVYLWQRYPARTCNFVRVLKTHKSMSENLNTIHSLFDFIWIFTFNGTFVLKYFCAIRRCQSGRIYGKKLGYKSHIIFLS